jgi:acyl-CoA thioesterase-1
MHSLVWLPLLLTLLMLTGCTKPAESVETSSRSPEPTPPPVAPGQTDSRKVIVAFGDSLSEGFGVEPGKSFPDQLQHKLDEKGLAYRVVNMGVSGDTTTGGLGRLDYAVSLKPSIAILELGGNDGLRGVPVASTKANLERMIIAFRKAGAAVLLAGMTLPPNYGPDYIRQFEAAYRDLAAKYKAPLIPFLMQDIASQLGSRKGLMQRDGIHPTAEGHTIIANTVYHYLEPLLERK